MGMQMPLGLGMGSSLLQTQASTFKPFSMTYQ
jgi:hypothetical protein